MGMQYGDDDDDDLFDSTEEDEEESESELSAEPPAKTQRPVPMTMARAAMQVNHTGGRRIRMRPMKPSMAEKHPDVVSILLTRNDGRQLLFVRK